MPPALDNQSHGPPRTRGLCGRKCDPLARRAKSRQKRRLARSMSSSDSQDDPSPDSGTVFSREAVTPRGGFMARPGLKPPPRHAVVVRGGDAPLEEAIPVARSSFPPPAPSEPEPLSMSEKATLRAIPKAKLPRLSTVRFEVPPPAWHDAAPPVPHVALDSAPPPSDAPLVQSVPPVSSGPRTRRQRSGWPVFVAGAAGLLLGLASVLATRGGSSDTPDASAATLAAARPVASPPEALPASPVPAATTPTPEASARAELPAATGRAEPASKPPTAPLRKSIF
jgi:hypothetical protein